LLAAANQLFYGNGVHTVGIDRVIEQAGVAKATLYSAFGSKDELIRSYLMSRHEGRRTAMQAIEQYESPRDRLLAIFDVLGESFVDPEYHGCAFVNANAEAAPGSPIEQVTSEYRNWIRGLFRDLAVSAGAAEPDQLARQLVMLYDGAGIARRIDRSKDAAAQAKAAAAVLLDAAISAA
jgi:AcrR family transcriptional regulator